MNADYLFPPNALMRAPGAAPLALPNQPSRSLSPPRHRHRHTSPSSLTAASAFPRSSDSSVAYLFREWQDRRSGEGADAGVGTAADVVLGAWACCRRVAQHSVGCVSSATHSQDALTCAQCGLAYAYLDNAVAASRGNRTCAHHAREPVASR